MAVKKMDVAKILAELKAEHKLIMEAVELERLERLKSRGRVKCHGRPPQNDPPPNIAAAAALPRDRRVNVWAVAGRKHPLSA